jgi:hypothetical protein
VRVEGQSRAAIYHDVWDALWQLERIEMDRV